MGEMLSVKNINVYYGSIHAIKDISFHVNEGEIVTLIGANGAGKTTTMHAISGLLKLQSGEIDYCGQTISKMEAHKIIRLGLAQVPEGRRVFSGLTVQQNLQMGAYTRRDGKEAIQNDFDMVFDLLPRLKERRNQPAGTLSGGEQQMLAMGRALMSHPKLLMLDEPLANLDLASQRATVHVLAKLNRELGMTIQVVAHDLNMLLPILTGAVYLLDGHPHYAGMNEVLDSHLLTHLYGTTVQVVTTPQGDMFVTPSEDESENMSIDAHAPEEIAQFHHHSHTTQED